MSVRVCLLHFSHENLPLEMPNRLLPTFPPLFCFYFHVIQRPRGILFRVTIFRHKKFNRCYALNQTTISTAQYDGMVYKQVSMK